MNFVDGYLCAFDWVEVFGGSNSSAPSLGRFCGLTAPQVCHHNVMQHLH